jgi:zinc resistance-associated protein
MKRILLGALTGVGLSASAFVLAPAIAAGDQPAESARAERMKHWAGDHQAMMDARLGGMKEALKLTATQYPLWEAFETAVRGGDKVRMDDMREMMQNRERMSPADRLDVMAGNMAHRAAELKKISEAAKPFYASLDDTQKRNFGLLSRQMLMSGMGVRWVEEGGDVGGDWLPEHWESMQ